MAQPHRGGGEDRHRRTRRAAATGRGAERRCGRGVFALDRVPGPTATVEGRLAVRTRERHADVQRLRVAGRSISVIARELGLDRRTTRRYARAENAEDLLVRARSRGSLLDPFKPYLHERFNAGHTDAAASPHRSRRWAIAASTKPYGATCSRSGKPAPRQRRCRSRPPSGRSPVGSRAIPTGSPGTTAANSSRSSTAGRH